jgi:hypothetical protein
VIAMQPAKILFALSLATLSSFALAADPAVSKVPASPAKSPAVKSTVSQPARGETRLTVRKVLNKRISSIDLQGVALADAIEYFRDVSDLNIHVNWNALASVNVNKDTAVNARLRYIPLRKALAVVLANAAGDAKALTFYSDDGVLEITTLAEADKQIITRTYFIDDIVMDIPDFKGPTFDLTQNNTSGGSGSGGGSSSQGLISSDSMKEEKTATKAERVEKLIALITKTIRPDVWEANGGTATISYFRGYLVIAAPRSVQEAIGGPID